MLTKEILDVEKEIKKLEQEPLFKEFLNELKIVNKTDNFMLKRGIDINTLGFVLNEKLSTLKSAQAKFDRIILAIKNNCDEKTFKRIMEIINGKE